MRVDGVILAAVVIFLVAMTIIISAYKGSFERTHGRNS